MDVPILERQLVARSSVDVDALGKGVEILRKTLTESSYKITTVFTINKGDALQNLDRLVASFKENPQLLSDMEIGLRLEFVGNLQFETLLICAASRPYSLKELVELAENKIALLSDDQLMDVWNRVQRWFINECRQVPQPIDKRLIPGTFLATKNLDEVRGKIARYFVLYQPRVRFLMIKANIHQWPVDGLGMAKILSWSSNGPNEELSDTLLIVAKSVGRIAALWKTVLHADSSRLLKVLGLEKNARLVKGPDFQEAEKAFQGEHKKLSYVLEEMRRIMFAAETIVQYRTPIERALRQYKLSLEVMTPEILTGLRGKKEVLLQKELCRFLLEREIFAVGTRFGRGETDLLAQEPTGEIVIETKIYRARVNERIIRRDLAQLHNYMDQSAIYRRGCLAIYNLSDSVIVAPQEWLQGRYWILPINLLRDVPSKQRRSVTIEASKKKELINVIVNEGDRSRAKRTRA